MNQLNDIRPPEESERSHSIVAPGRPRATGRSWRSPAGGPSAGGPSVRVDPHRLDVEVLVERLLAHLQAPAAHLVAAEGNGGVEEQHRVDPHRPGPQLAGQP